MNNLLGHAFGSASGSDQEQVNDLPLDETMADRGPGTHGHDPPIDPVAESGRIRNHLSRPPRERAA